MTRSVMSKKAMEWICFCLKEASKEHKKETRRWKLAERETELFCTKKQNEYGKFMSLITLNSGGRSGLIIPELALNAGWVDIALKIERFIKSQQREKEHSFSRVTEDEYSYAEAVQQMNIQEEDLLKRCLIGYCTAGKKEKPTLADIRSWSSTIWKKAFRVNIYELNSEMFLFEFPNRYMVELIIQGQWRWKSSIFHLDWWRPTTRCTPNPSTMRETWIRVVGIPLHLWSRKVFQEIGDLCGGWIETEEETELKNHLKWARILVKNNRRNLPREVSVACDGITYFFPIWAESKPKFKIRSESGGIVAEEDEVLCPRNSFIPRSDGVNICDIVPKSHPFRDFSTSKHVGCTSTAGKTIGNGAPHVVFNDLQGTKLGCTETQKDHILAGDITALHVSNSGEAKQNMNTKVVTERLEEQIRGDLMIPGEEEPNSIDRGDDGKITKSGETGLAIQSSNTEIVNWEVKEPVPIMVQQQQRVQDVDKANSTWVQQNLIKLGKIFGIDFQGDEEEATELLLQIDSCRQVRRMEQDTEVKKLKIKGAQELKSLVAFDEWKQEEGGNLGNQRRRLLEQLAELDTERVKRTLTVEETTKKAAVLLEYEELVKKDEVSWRQKSRVLWLKEGDEKTKFFHKMANAHRRYNNIDQLMIQGEVTQEKSRIEGEIIAYYKNMYRETHQWRPYNNVECPMLTEEEKIPARQI
ncbi:hypothetical protein H5410_027341 [Solanum commersonii]|uniref:DUF4283 domain-containing protein n=1 Tax=Solanum commersonii TaxID=4109 RepID=A0A9J5YYY5_SOLCO|nr:hypothetical protein H5410_027341 [Solanum commersonii]